MVKRIFKNIGYNVIYQIVVVLIPFVSIPYLTRIFDPNMLGLYSYIFAITSIFMIVAQFGILNFGAKEIAKAVVEKQDINQRFIQIWLIQVLMSILSFLLYMLLIFLYKDDNYMFLVLNSLLILSVIFDVSWLFIGLEKLNLVLVRNIIVKVLTLASIFIFVNEKNDLLIYFLINIISTLLSFIVSFSYLFKIIDFSKLSINIVFSNFFKDLKNTSFIFLPHMLSVIYLNGDRILVQYLSNLYQVGLYDQSQKILRMIVTLITSCNFALLPFFSKIFNSSDKKNADKVFFDLLNVVFVTSLILSLLFWMNINSFVEIFFNEKYYGTIILFKYGILQIIFSSLSMFISQNYLIIQNKQIYLIPIMFMTILLGFVLGYIFIPIYGAIGGVISIILAEFVSLLLHGHYLKKSGYTNSLSLNIGYLISLKILAIFLIFNFIYNYLDIKNMVNNGLIDISLKSIIFLICISPVLFQILKNNKIIT